VLADMHKNFFIKKDIVIIDGQFISEQSLLGVMDFHLLKDSWLTTVMYEKGASYG
jgi:hypothetical protein